MPKKIIKGVGMMAHEVEVFDLRSDDPNEREALIGAFERFAETMPIREEAEPVGQALRRENAERCQRILAAVGIEDSGKAVIDKRLLVSKGIGEDSRPWIAAEWLAAYHGLCRNMERLKSDSITLEVLGRLLTYSEDLGRLQERMWWRAEVDPFTNKSPEKLALGKRAQELATPKATQARRRKAAEFEPDWWDDARQQAAAMRRKYPSYSRSRIAKVVADEFERSERQVAEVIKHLWP